MKGAILKTVMRILLCLVALLAVTACAEKVIMVPQEVEFLQGFGFSVELIVGFGIVQILGALLLAIPRTTLLGLLISVLGYAVSSALIFVDGNYGFAFMSIFPIAIIVSLYLYTRNALNNALTITGPT